MKLSELIRAALLRAALETDMSNEEKISLLIRILSVYLTVRDKNNYD